MPEPPIIPTKPKTRNAEALAKKPLVIRQRRQVKGDAALILALPTAKATSASAQEPAPRLSIPAHSSAILTLVKIINEPALYMKL